jgi:hypothetical protein
LPSAASVGGLFGAAGEAFGDRGVNRRGVPAAYTGGAERPALIHRRDAGQGSLPGPDGHLCRPSGRGIAALAAYRTKNKAAQDADFSPWTAEQVREFAAELERTPANHHELWDLAVDRLINRKNDLEGGDTSLAPILALATKETAVRNFIGGWCRDRAAGRYTIPQEEELADAKRPDLRFQGAGFDAPVPIELKLTDAGWTGPNLFERLENQLCGDYLRDVRSSRGIFLLVHNGGKSWWEHPAGGRLESFDALLQALRQHWGVLSSRMANVEDIAIIGIDLTKRASA